LIHASSWSSVIVMRMSFRDTVQAATPAPIEGKLQTKKTHCTNLFVVCACVFVLFTGLLYHSVRFIAISFSCRLCGSVASPALLYCAPAPTFYENGSSSSIPSGMFIKPFASVSGCAGACWFPCCPAAALLSANSHSSTMTSVVYTLPPSLLV